MEPWICPRCGIVHAGWVAQCTCKPPVMSITSTGTLTLQCTCHLNGRTTAPQSCPIHDRQWSYTTLERVNSSE